MQTIAELAQTLGVTKQAIHHKIDKLGIRNELQKVDGTYYLTDEQAGKIRSTATNSAIHPKENRKDPAHVPTRKSDRHKDNKIIELLERRIEAQEKQIEKKDAQIEALQKEQTRLHDLLDQQQKLTLIAEQKRLALEDQQNKGIFARLFHRSKPTEQPQEPQKEETREAADE